MLNIFSAKFMRFSLIIEVGERVFILQTFRSNNASLISVYFNYVLLLLVAGKVTEAANDMTPI